VWQRTQTVNALRASGQEGVSSSPAWRRLKPLAVVRDKMDGLCVLLCRLLRIRYTGIPSQRNQVPWTSVLLRFDPGYAAATFADFS